MPRSGPQVHGRLGWMGLTQLNNDANQKNATCISTPESPVQAFVIPTNEERVIAEEALAVSNGKSQ
jgi:acetate kinase